MKLDDVVTTVRGEAILVSDVLDYTKVAGVFRAAVIELIKQHVIDIKCREHNIVINNEQIEEAFERKRKLAGLSSPQDFSNHLKSNGATLEQWRKLVENELKLEKLKNVVVDSDTIKKYFTANHSIFHRVSLARIVCGESDIEEVLKRLGRGEAFADLAAAYSQDKPSGRIGG